jgi:hypothetical protein
VLVEELGQAVDESSVDNLFQWHPGRLRGVGAGDGITGVEDRHREIEDDVVVAVADSFDPADESVGDTFDACLLSQLAHNRFDEHLTGFHPAAGNRPQTGSRPVTAAHKEEAVGVDGDRPDGHLGPRAPVALKPDGHDSAVP